jgi:membrane-bound lytic murein transglycosylase D
VGVWQFAAFRGKEYGLAQTATTDDRMDPERATRAAAKHLHDLYDHFGDWYLAMAAYNCGPGCVDKAIQRTGYADFWELRRLNVLPRETANYVPAILAMTIIAKNARDYGLDDVPFETPVEYDSVELESATHMALIAEAIDRPLSELRDLNPSVLRSVAPAGHMVHVPKGTLPQVEAALDAVPAARRDAWRVHRVEYGETLADLARRFNTTSAAITAANRDQMPEAGVWVAIPVSYPGDRLPSKSARAAVSRTASSHSGATHSAAAHKPTATAASAKAVPAAKPAAAHTTVRAAAPSVAQHKSAAKPAPKSMSKAPQQHPAARS